MDQEREQLRRKITELEENAAHQGRTIEELSAQIATQWKIIDLMQKKLDQLGQRFFALEEASLEAPPITRPPHY